MIATLTSFNVLNRLEMDIRVDQNPFGLDLSDLFSLGARVNPKRSFLFISKLIGKHLAVHPDTPKATGYLLANLLAKKIGNQYFSDIELLTSFLQTSSGGENLKAEFSHRYDLPESTLFIGFAETATGLGHSVFSAFENAFYVHTTREEIESTPSIFNFEEEHSHAVDHRCYLIDERWMRDCKQIVLIDDEMTTGKTTLNLIRAMHKVYPKQTYYVLSLLDWRTKEQEEAYRKMEMELGVQIHEICLVRGEIEVTKEAYFEYDPEQVVINQADYENVIQPMIPKIEERNNVGSWNTYLLDTGRFGIMSAMHDIMEDGFEQAGLELRGKRKSKQTLVMGAGEFMYIPSRIAAYMGDGVTHKTTTRSPIYPSQGENYPIYERISYTDDKGVQYFMYNMSGSCDEVFFIFEESPSNRLKNEIASQLQGMGIDHIHFVYV